MVEQHNRSSSALQPGRTADMVNMCVSDDDLFQDKPKCREPSENVVDLIAWINDNSFAGIFIREDRAVTLQRTYRKGFKDHTYILRAIRLAWLKQL